jgi:4'-phosphopantetheinyl transferase
MNWVATAKVGTLGDHGVHVWGVNLDETPSQGLEPDKILSNVEIMRANRFVFAKDRQRFVRGRIALRRLLAKYLSQDPAEVEISIGEFGKPFVCKSLNLKPIMFNASHSSGFCLFAFTRDREIGIDVEKNRSDIEPLDLARRYFAPSELSELKTLPSDQIFSGFFRCWTRKESYIKARGKGLQIPLDSFAVSLNAEDPVTLNSPDSSKWQVISFEPQLGFTAAITIEVGKVELSYWKYIS